MKLPSNVKVKNGFWRIFPFSKYTAQAIYPNIYFQRNVFNNLKSREPNPLYVAALKHEQTHIKRQKEIGPFIWGLKYVFSSKFRLNEEIEALKSTMKHLKINGFDFDTSQKAQILSSWLYLWCVSYRKAKKSLDKIWKET